MARKVYIHPADSYLGRTLGKTCKEQGYEVLGGYSGQEAPAFLSTSYQIGTPSASAAQRQFLATADAVIYEMHGYEQAARDAVVHMAKQPFGGRQQLFIGVSTPLVWAATRPTPAEEDLDVPDSASDLMAAAGENTPQISGQEPLPRALSHAGSVAALSHCSTKSSRPLDAYATAAALGALTDRDALRRAPCLRVREVHELEQLVVRCQRKGKLRTAVVCPGMLYGRGEADEGLHALMRTAWELEHPLKIYGTGNNHLPMMHVEDCASFLAALCGAPQPGPATPLQLMAGLPDTQQYLLAADCPAPGHPGGVQQRELTVAIAEQLGTGSTLSVPSEELLFTPGVEQWTLNTPLACSPLPAGCGYSPRYSDGIMAHLGEVIQQWRDARRVNPLRVILAGPPMAGKSVVAARLAAMYRLPLYDAKQLLACADKLSSEDAKALAAEMSGKDPRASVRSLAALLRAALTTNKTAVNRGYVLDAVVKTGGHAKWAFMKAVPMTEEEIVAKTKDDLALRAASPAKGAKAGAAATPVKKGKGAPGDDGPVVPAGQKLVPDTELVPTHLVQVDATPEELSGRRAAVEILELDAARSATPPDTAAKPGAKGGKDKGGPTSHNNEKDYARRQAVWAQIKADEQADLEAQVAAAQARWERQQAEREAERLQAEAEARTLRARRRRAREAAAAAASQGAAAPQDGSTAPGPFNASTSLQQLDATAGEGGLPGASLGNTEATVEGTFEPEQPPLPQYGGLAGVLVGSCGTQYLQLSNGDRPGGPPVTAASWERDEEEEAVADLAPLQGQLVQFLGPARNFEGMTLTSSEGPLPSSSGQKPNRQKSVPKPPQDTTLLAELQRQAQAAAVQAQRSLTAQHASVAEPVRKYIMANVMPTVTDALRMLSVNRSMDPIRFLAQHLLDTAEQLEATYIDPYTDTSYEVQRQKLADKEARDAARALAAEQKAEKELAAKAAAKQAAASAEAAVAAEAELTDLATPTPVPVPVA